MPKGKSYVENVGPDKRKKGNVVKSSGGNPVVTKATIKKAASPNVPKASSSVKDGGGFALAPTKKAQVRRGNTPDVKKPPKIGKLKKK